MNRSQSPNSGGQRAPLWKARSTAGAIVVAALVGGYSLVAPAISNRIGIDLPALSADRDGAVRVGESKTAAEKPAAANDSVASNAFETSAKLESKSVEKSGDSSRKSSTSSNSASSAQKVSDNSRPAIAKSEPSAASTKTNELLYGRLKEISPDRFVSMSGLMYTPGSAEGHRLEHLRRHTQDQPSRPGSHGVFDGEMPGAIKTIDMAYERAKKGQRTTTKKDRGRMIYTVDMGKRVGFVGGREGNRKRKPMARRVRLVLEGNRVITAYPM